MEQRPRPFRLLLASPLIAMGLAAGAAYFLADEREPEPSSPVPAPAADAPALHALPPAPTPTPSAVVPAAAPVAAAQPAPTLALEVPPPADEPNAGLPPQLADPKIREHARLMVIETLRVALKQGDLGNLQRVRATVRDEHIESLIAPADLQAVDLGIACISQAPEARQRALDFLDENSGNQFAEGLRIACLQ